MNIFEFGDAKLKAKDVDPLYRAIHAQEWSQELRCRFTLAFVSFDHAGLACRAVAAGPKGFWPAMHDLNAQTIRGAPRRYFRGIVASDALRAIEARYGSALKALLGLEGTFTDAAGTINATWPQYGPTAAFKLCDMAERVCGVKVDFADVTPKQLMSNAMVTKGVAKAARELGLDSPEALFKVMRRHWRKTPAPPTYDRLLNMQEFETILCYYSHDEGKNRHLPGMDIENIKGELMDPKIWWSGPGARFLGFSIAEALCTSL